VSFTGHGFCDTCVDHMFAQDTRICPMCRSRINQRDAHRIFLEFVDPAISYGMSVVDGLNRIDHMAELRSVSKAKEKLERAALRAQGNEELTVRYMGFSPTSDEYTPNFLRF